MAQKGQFNDGQRLRQDSAAPSTSADLPAFLARPANAPVYHGFPLLAGSAKDGFEFERWGVYQFRFEIPVRSDADLICNLHAILPRLKEFHAAAQSANQGPDPSGPRG